MTAAELMARGYWFDLWIIAAVVAAAVAAFSILEMQSSNGLLDEMALIQPGAKLDTIKPKLEKEIHTIDDLDQMISMGTVKDRNFCNGKRLHTFIGARWPWRSIDVYTDKNDVVLFVTWRQE